MLEKESDDFLTGIVLTVWGLCWYNSSIRLPFCLFTILLLFYSVPLIPFYSSILLLFYSFVLLFLLLFYPSTLRFLTLSIYSSFSSSCTLFLFYPFTLLFFSSFMLLTLYLFTLLSVYSFSRLLICLFKSLFLGLLPFYSFCSSTFYSSILLLFHFLFLYSFTRPFFALLCFTLLIFPFVLLFCSFICDVARTSEVPQLNFDPLSPDPPLRWCSFSMARVGKHNASINIKCSCVSFRGIS